MLLRLKYFSIIGFLLGLLLAEGCLMSYSWITSISEKRITSNIDDLTNYDVALVLGTSKRVKSGGSNPYFKNRIDAAVELYFSGKVKKILVSGDNAQLSYNEPRDMLNALVANGVPQSDIILDYAGFRTFDSMVRAREVFGQTRFIVVSQQFHAERAIYIGRSKNMDVVGYTAKDPNSGSNMLFVRELLARAKALLDCNLLGTTPKFLGEKIDIGV